MEKPIVSASGTRLSRSTVRKSMKHFQRSMEFPHHIAEGMFKAVSRALRKATASDPEACGEIPSTKGLL